MRRLRVYHAYGDLTVGRIRRTRRIRLNKAHVVTIYVLNLRVQ